MKKRELKDKKIILVLLIVILSFTAGFFTSYKLITTTTLIPINYGEKFKQYYKEQKRIDFVENYVDLTNGFVFSYANYYDVDIDRYWVWQEPLEVRTGLALHEGETKHVLSKTRVDDLDLMKYAEKSEVFPWQGEREVKYTRTTINGSEAVLAEFVVTEEQKELTAFSKGGEHTIIDEPVGFKGKIVYIKHNGYIYIWKTGNLNNLSAENDFDFIVQSFKFIY